MNKLDKELKYIKINDLIFVILYGGVISSLLGILIGFTDYTIQKAIGFTLYMILFFISSSFIGKMVRKQYENPHIIYTVFTGVFLVFQGLLGFAIPTMLKYTSIIGGVDALLNVRYFFNLFFEVLKYLMFSSFNSILILVMLFVGTYLGIKKTY